MYKWLLCWRYLRTRYLAFLCLASVALGVNALIVVNSVIGGFSSHLADRLHALHADVSIDSTDYEGFGDVREKMDRVRSEPELRGKVAAMAATFEVYAMLRFQYQGKAYTRPVRVIGIDPEERAAVGGFAEYLVPSPNEGRRIDLGPEEALPEKVPSQPERTEGPPLPVTEPPPPEAPPSSPTRIHGAIVGHGLVHYRPKSSRASDEDGDIRLLEPGDEILITTATGERLKPVYDRFAVRGYAKTGLSEFDGNCVYVSRSHLQTLLGRDDGATSIHLRLTDPGEAPEVVSRLRQLFDDPAFDVQTWQDKQGHLLAAIAVEKGILNVLLFLIVAVAGFGILAIFSMIVNEKTRDVGVLRAVGASKRGVMAIFLGYGLFLGVVGAALGTCLGLALTAHIDAVERLLGLLTGQDVFPRDVYYFDRIPTRVSPLGVAVIDLGAVAVAVLFSILPALRAARLRPAESLRA